MVNAHRFQLVEPVPAPSVAPPPVANPLPEKKIVTRMREHYAAVQHLRGQGLSNPAVGRKLGLHAVTVCKFAQARSVDV
ncbi:hypothetical protein DMH04_47860 [Kibdelosporangium aridum]|uniref:Uncharacterized protein n=1 Tax=Kibdelosporangium aridum TaxID=2030 RepID=A0A428YK11_KIBAR|nr:hypothetical protein [Kibdelosporangium aridum]RSM67896.1 hypothetical protein DMH04_47860 [Kibdelosporangium aridum]